MTTKITSRMNSRKTVFLGLTGALLIFTWSSRTLATPEDDLWGVTTNRTGTQIYSSVGEAETAVRALSVSDGFLAPTGQVQESLTARTIFYEANPKAVDPNGPTGVFRYTAFWYYASQGAGESHEVPAYLNITSLDTMLNFWLYNKNPPYGQCGFISYHPTSDWDISPGTNNASREYVGYYTVATYVWPTPQTPVFAGCVAGPTSRIATVARTQIGTLECPDGYTYDSNTGECLNSATAQITVPKTEAPEDCLVGNPCLPANGDKFQAETDYEGPTLQFVRSYHSDHLVQPQRDTSIGSIGRGWTHNYAARIEFNQSSSPIGLIRPNGFRKTLGLANNTWYTLDGSSIKLRLIGSEYVVYLPSGETETYSVSGRLSYLTDRSGQQITLTYNAASGLLEAVSDSFGHRLLFGWVSADGPAAMELYSITDPAGRRIHYTVDAIGNMTQVEYADLSTRIYHYEDTNFASLLTGITDENDQRFSTYAYDSRGRIYTSEHAGGIGRYTFQYSTDGDTVVSDAELNDETYTFGSNAPGIRRPTSRILGGETISATFESAQNRLESRTTAGRTTRYDYNDALNKVTQTDGYGSALARQIVTTYIADTNHLPAIVDSPSVLSGQIRRVDYSYCTAPLSASCPAASLVYQMTEKTVNTSGQVVSGTPIRTTTFGYNAYGHVTSIDGPRADVSDTTAIAWWDEDPVGTLCISGGKCGQLKSITNALNHTTSFNEYYADGRLKKMTQPNNLVITYAYDLRGRVDTITETPASGTPRVTNYDYDDAGQIDDVTLPNGLILDFHWTEAHLLDYVADNSLSQIDFSYDSRGNRNGEDLKSSDGTVRKSLALVLDSRNRIDTLVNGSNNAAGLDFDAAGNLDYETDPNGNPKDYVYDALNRLDTVTDALSGLTDYDFDAKDSLAMVTAPNGAITTYEHDDLSNLLQEVSPDRGSTLYGYDEAGNMTCKADGRYSGAATICENVSNRWTYAYDALNRVTSINYGSTGANPDVSFQWDTRSGAATQVGRLRQVTYVQGSVTVTRKMDYDAWGNVTWSQQSITEGSTKTLTASYQYDGNNQITDITYPSGRVVHYNRSSNGRITGITATPAGGGSAATVVSNVSYSTTPFGPPRTFSYGNGLQRVALFDAAYAPAILGMSDPSTEWIYELLAYDTDGAGNIGTIEDVYIYTHTYGYDDLNRLTLDPVVSSTDPTYTYDANGNRLHREATETGFYDQDFNVDVGSNRIDTNSYDGMGNVTATTVGHTFTYDAGGRMSEIWDTGSAMGLREVYNGMGEVARTRRYVVDACDDEVLQALEYFTFAPDGRALELVSANNSRTESDWIWLDDMPVAQFTDSYDAGGTPQGTTVTYLYSDHLGTPRMGTNASKQVTWEYKPDAFGVGTTPGTAVVRLRLPGQIDLGIGGINYNYYRDYYPQEGRYLESDPIGINGGLNTYAYADGNPLSNVDPTGLMCFAFDQFARDIEENRFDLGATAATLGAALAVGTMPKTPSELRGLGVPRGQLNPYTSQLSRMGGRTGIRALRELGRTSGAIALGTIATGALVFEGFYDLSVIGQSAIRATSSDDCKCPQ